MSFATPATGRSLPASFWLALCTLALAAYPLIANLVQVLADPSMIGAAFGGLGFDVYRLQYVDFVTLPFVEPLVLIAAAIVNLVSRNRIVRALPGLLFVAGFVLFLLLNMLFSVSAAANDWDVDAWLWTVGPMPQAAFYVVAVLLALVTSIVALVEKKEEPEPPWSTHPCVGQPEWDPETGRPILRYDEETGKPIYLD